MNDKVTVNANLHIPSLCDKKIPAVREIGRNGSFTGAFIVIVEETQASKTYGGGQRIIRSLDGTVIASLKADFYGNPKYLDGED